MATKEQLRVQGINISVRASESVKCRSVNVVYVCRLPGSRFLVVRWVTSQASERQVPDKKKIKNCSESNFFFLGTYILKKVLFNKIYIKKGVMGTIHGHTMKRT